MQQGYKITVLNTYQSKFQVALPSPETCTISAVGTLSHKMNLILITYYKCFLNVFLTPAAA